MRVSVIVAVYRDIRALELVLDSLKNQTYKNFEVIVVEDGSFDEMRKFLKAYNGLDVKHTTQEDLGVRKARSQNNGILASSGEYLIFVDGDCLLYSTFVEGHVNLARDGVVLAGRRLNLNKQLTKKLRDGDLNSLDIEKKLFTKHLNLAFDRSARFEQGICIKENSFIYKYILTKRKRNTSILGCNFSCYKSDMIAVNGFDESYGETAIPDDMDFDWRFQAYGLKLMSCKNIANMFHLEHSVHDRGDATPFLKVMNDRKKRKQYICEKGLNTHD